MKSIRELIKSEMKKIFGDKICYVACFFISLFIIGIIYFLKEVLPFGKNTLLDSDFYYQYSVMLAEVRDRIFSHSNLAYSFRSGLGMPLYRNFINYLSSPINIISLFFPRERFMMSFSFIIGLKAVLASCFMLWFLNHRKGKNCVSYIPFALLYAFSGYFSNYYINIMWLDSMMLIPLIAIGIDNIISKKKWMMYCIVLAICIFSNYYTGYMICIFACLYFIYSFIIHTNFGKIDKKTIREVVLKLLKTGVIFTLASLMAVLLCITPLMLIKNSMSTLAASDEPKEFQTEFYFELNTKDILFSHFNGAFKTLFYSDKISVPGMSVGVLSVFLTIIFLFNRKISLKEKIASIIFVTIYLTAFFKPQLDYIFHAFHAPNDFPYRYAFIYSFIFITISARSFDEIKNAHYPSALIAFGMLIGAFIWYGMQLEDVEEVVINRKILIYNVIFLTLYSAIVIIGMYYNMNKIITFWLIVCVSTEIVLMYNNKWNIDQDEVYFINDYKDSGANVEWLSNNDNEKFYRTEKINYLSLNDGCWNEYNGVTLFSSMAYNKLSEFQYALGIPGNGEYSYIYNDTSPLYNLLFDVKYVIGSFDFENDDYSLYYEKVNEEGGAINKFKYTSGIGYAVDYKMINVNVEDTNPFALQNDIVKKASRIEDDIFVPTAVETKEIHSDSDRIIYEYKIKSTENTVYFHSNSYDIDFIKIGEKIYVGNYSNTLYEDYDFLFPNISYDQDVDFSDHGIIKVNTQGQEPSIYIAYNAESDYEEPSFYTFNNSVFIDFYNEINDERLEIVDFKENCIDAKILLKEDALVYTSIPFDEGWNVYIDEEKVDTYSIADSMLCFYSDKGEHKIKIEYKIPYIGVIMSINICAIISLIGYYFVSKRKGKIKKSKEHILWICQKN